MDFDSIRDGKRRNYHHGNLREALVETAMRLIREKGPAGFTFAEAARAAGVSPAAPYRHFRDRDDLLAEVALRGYEGLAESLNAAAKTAATGPVDLLDRLGRAYLGFARQDPATFSAMFEAGLELGLHPALQAASDRAFEPFRVACEQVTASLPPGRRAPALMVALHIWSLAHGIASLFSRGDKARRPLPMPAEDLLEAAILVYFDGLGVAQKKS